MFCDKCGTKVEENYKVCPNCGNALQTAQPAAPVQPPVPVQPSTPVVPPENRPLSPWAYWGLQLLFAVPVVGFIFLIIFSFNSGNINRRNFARSYWCSLAILGIIAAILLIMTMAGASVISFADWT